MSAHLLAPEPTNRCGIFLWFRYSAIAELHGVPRFWKQKST